MYQHKNLNKHWLNSERDNIRTAVIDIYHNSECSICYVMCHTVLFSADVDLFAADAVSSVGEG